jgi:DNA repair protein RadC
MSDAETLALVISVGCGAQSAYGTALNLLRTFGSLSTLALAEPSELEQITGIGRVKATQIHAAIQLGRRSISSSCTRSTPIVHPRQAAQILAPQLQRLAYEELHALYLDHAHNPLAQRQLSRGTQTKTLIDTKLVFRPALALGAAAVIIAHNHPSGDPDPSTCDRETTEKLVDAGKLLGFMLLDHLVIGEESSYSIRLSCEFPHAF